MKHLIFLIDGTWLTPSHVLGDSTFSNIYRINLMLQKQEGARDGNPQIVFYSRGLGAVTGPMKYFAGGFAYSLKEEIEDVYINLAANYAEGDNIYLFGFSRGAVVARVVAALIARFGLLYPNKIEFFNKIWSAYKSYSITQNPELFSKDRGDLCWSSSAVEFLGVFDTVYGGNHNPKKLRERLQFAGNNLSSNVKNAVHILAIDEQRPFFRPLLWEESNDHPSLEQIWMPGVHGDIGGCYPADALGKASLLAMVKRTIQKTQLAFLDGEIGSKTISLNASLDEPNVSVNDEWSTLWKTICIGQKYTRRPPKAASNQALHPLALRLEDIFINHRGDRHAPYQFDARFGALKVAEDQPFSSRAFCA